jgi:hypothetical protein
MFIFWLKEGGSSIGYMLFSATLPPDLLPIGFLEVPYLLVSVFLTLKTHIAKNKLDKKPLKNILIYDYQRFIGRRSTNNASSRSI